MKQVRPLDFLILILILISVFFSFKKTVTPVSDKIMVQANGIKYEYSLDKDGVYTVEGAIGPTTFEIKNKSVHIIDSACPNKNCVHQGWANPLVCLPNKVIITYENTGEFDAISE